MTECSVPGCINPAAKRTWCASHYRRWQRHGDVQPNTPLRIIGDLHAQLMAKVDRRGPDECWPWIGAIMPTGYGSIRVRKTVRLAHRVAYELLIGPIPDGLTIDHLCSVRHCVNPHHLEPVTRAENNRRRDDRRSAA